MYSLKEKLIYELESRFDSIIESVPGFLLSAGINEILQNRRSIYYRREAVEKVVSMVNEFVKRKIIDSLDLSSIFADCTDKFTLDIDHSLNSLCSEIDGACEVYEMLFEKGAIQAAGARMIEKARLLLNSIEAKIRDINIPMKNNVYQLEALNLVTIIDIALILNPVFLMEIYNPPLIRRTVEIKTVEMINSKRKDFRHEISEMALKEFKSETQKLVDFIIKEMKEAEEKINLTMKKKPEIENWLSEIEEAENELAKLDEEILELTFASMGF
jgi:hypothetical protein